jgi:hypothetical protein
VEEQYPDHYKRRECLRWHHLPVHCKRLLDHIFYSVSYPFLTNEEGKLFIKELQGGKMMSGGDLELLAYRNEENLLGLKAARFTQGRQI